MYLVRAVVLSSLLVSSFTFAESGVQTPVGNTPSSWATNENCKAAWDFSRVETDVYQTMPEGYSASKPSKTMEDHCMLISIHGNNPEGEGTCSVVAKCSNLNKLKTDPAYWVMNEFTTNVSGSLSYIKANDTGHIYGYK